MDCGINLLYDISMSDNTENIRTVFDDYATIERALRHFIDISIKSKMY